MCACCPAMSSSFRRWARRSGSAGEVRRPAIYELKDETTASELLRLGGGLMPDADPTHGNARTHRSAAFAHHAGRRSQPGTGSGSQAAERRHRCAFRRFDPPSRSPLAVNGYVHRPGEYQFRPGMRIADVIPSLDELKPNADQRYILVRRELPPDRRIQVFSANLEQALANPDSDANFVLAPRDQIFVFDLESGRDRIVEPLMRELGMHSRLGEPTQEVSVAGKIKVPGKYPLEPGMRVSDLIRAGGSLDEAAYGGQAELTRYEVTNGEVAPGGADRDRSAQGAGGRSARRRGAAAVRLPGHQGNPAVGCAGRSGIARRSEIPRALSDPSRRDVALRRGARRRPDRPCVRRGRNLHPRGTQGAGEEAARDARDPHGSRTSRSSR